MQTLDPIILVAGALIVAALSAAITRSYYRTRIHRTEQDAWNRARIFYRHNPPASSPEN